jgi:hypothetical protein
MKFNNLPNEIYSHIFEYFECKDARELMLVCKACHLPARRLYYTEVILYNNYQQFLAFLKNEHDGIIPRSIKSLRMNKGWSGEYNKEEFIFVIQSLKGLETLNLNCNLEEQYFEIMINDMQTEDLKHIRSIIVPEAYPDSLLNKLYVELIYKLRGTITRFRVFSVFPYSWRPNQSYPGLRYLSELKSLAHLSYHASALEDMDFFTILRACPNLRSLYLYEIEATALVPPSKDLGIFHNNLKNLKMQLCRFPQHYMAYIINCIDPTIDLLELIISKEVDMYSIFFGFEMTLIDQFLAHLSKMKEMKLILSRYMLEETYPKCVNIMARTWHIVKCVRGNHRREKMITRASVFLALDPDSLQCHRFIVRKNKHFSFHVAFNLLNNMNLEDVPKHDIEDVTMINSLTIRDERMPSSNICLLQFIQYMVKRCTRINHIIVLNPYRYGTDHIVFAPIAMASVSEYEEEENIQPPFECVTTPTEENILYASYSWMLLDKFFLKSTLQLFPNIETVKIDGCDFEESAISIDLTDLKHLRRIELDLAQVYKRKSALFAVHIENYGTINYFYERFYQYNDNKIFGPFEPASIIDNTQEKDDYLLVNIFCVKLDEMAIYHNYLDEKAPSYDFRFWDPFSVVHPLSDFLDRYNQM